MTVPEPSPGWRLGYEMFQMLFEERGLSVAGRLESVLENPSESVVLLFGDQRHLSPGQLLRLRRFVAQGGSLLIATERGLNLPGVCTFSAGFVTTGNPENQYGSFQDCLSLQLSPDHPLTAGLNRLIVNRTGWLTEPEDDSLKWTAVAFLPAGCRPSIASGRPVVLAGIDADPNPGVMILSADQSLFSNGMVWHGDNSLFVIRVADLLCRGARKRVIALSGRETLPGYEQSPVLNPSAAAPPVTPNLPRQPPIPPRIPPVTPPTPDLATMLRTANRVIDRIQESDILNETLRDRPRNMRPLAWLRTALLILLLAVLAYTLFRLSRRRSHLAALRQPRFMQSMFGAVTARQVAKTEFGSAAEVLARDLCTSLTGSGLETDWLKLLNGGGAISRLSRAQRKGLREIVGIAMRGCRIHISRRKFQALGRQIHELRLMPQLLVTTPLAGGARPEPATGAAG